MLSRTVVRDAVLRYQVKAGREREDKSRSQGIVKAKKRRGLRENVPTGVFELFLLGCIYGEKINENLQGLRREKELYVTMRCQSRATGDCNGPLGYPIFFPSISFEGDR